MRIPNLFVVKFVTVDRLASRAIVVCEVTTLGHETLDYSMEEITFVGQIFSFLASTKRSEIFSGFRHLLSE